MSGILNNLFEVTEIATQAIDHIGDNVCSEPGFLKAIRLVGYLLSIAKYFVPVIIIVWGTIDIYISVTKGSAYSLKKEAIQVLWRAMLGVAICLLPSVIGWAVLSLGKAEPDTEKCINCLTDPYSCSVS